jgi:predicted PurR-regulated permease PerM
MSASAAVAPRNGPSVRAVLRTVLVIVGVVLALYLAYLLRQPIGWIVLAAFIAVALSGPVNLLGRWMRRGFAIALTYVGVILIPVAIALIFVPPLVREGSNLVDKLPQYATDVRTYLDKSRTFRKLQQDYQIGTKLQDEANKLPQKAGGAAKTLGNIGIGFVSSLFAAVNILFLSIFMVARGRRWVEAFLKLHPPDRAVRLERMADRIAEAIGNYVGGALLQATIAGITTFIVLTVLGVPFAGPLAILTALFDLIPLVGATIGAIIVGVVTVFSDFPTVTIVWTVWAIVYQQIENTVIQPRIQSKAVDVQPFIVLVSVLFGSTLFGIAGALLAIPVAASIQIAVREYWNYLQEGRRLAASVPPSVAAPGPPPPSPGGAPGTA